MRGLDEAFTECYAFWEVVDVQEHELNPDQCKSRPSKETVSVLESVVEAFAKGGIGEDDDAKEFCQDDVGDGNSSDRSLR